MTKRPLTAARSTKHVLREIGCPYLSLYRGDGYWYFTYDTLKAAASTRRSRSAPCGCLTCR